MPTGAFLHRRTKNLPVSILNDGERKIVGAFRRLYVIMVI